MSKRTRFWGVALMAAALASVAPARAEDEDLGVPDTPAWNANVGFVTSTGIAILIPDEGSVGGGLELSGRYGIPAGPFVVGPGARIGGYYVSERVIGVLMPTLRVTAPLG